MADAQHTPGPWTWVRTSSGSHFRYLDAGNRIVVDSEEYAGSAWIEIENEADARLIAAAPDMLAALSLAKRMVDEALPKFDWGRSCLDANAIRLLNEAPVLINSAIAKAGGSNA